MKNLTTIPQTEATNTNQGKHTRESNHLQRTRETQKRKIIQANDEKRWKTMDKYEERSQKHKRNAKVTDAEPQNKTGKR